MTEQNQQFDTHAQWVSKAASWLTRHPDYQMMSFNTVCVDSFGRRCLTGSHMARARDEGAFPVHWWWPDQTIPELDTRHPHPVVPGVIGMDFSDGRPSQTLLAVDFDDPAGTANALRKLFEAHCD